MRTWRHRVSSQEQVSSHLTRCLMTCLIDHGSTKRVQESTFPRGQAVSFFLATSTLYITCVYHLPSTRLVTTSADGSHCSGMQSYLAKKRTNGLILHTDCLLLDLYLPRRWDEKSLFLSSFFILTPPVASSFTLLIALCPLMHSFPGNDGIRRTFPLEVRASYPFHPKLSNAKLGWAVTHSVQCWMSSFNVGCCGRRVRVIFFSLLIAVAAVIRLHISAVGYFLWKKK